MTEAAKEKRREYLRKWRAANRDKIKAYEERHWEKVAAQDAARRQIPEPAQEE